MTSPPETYAKCFILFKVMGEKDIKHRKNPVDWSIFSTLIRDLKNGSYLKNRKIVRDQGRRRIATGGI
jgi:hypothetical protein